MTCVLIQTAKHFLWMTISFYKCYVFFDFLRLYPFLDLKFLQALKLKLPLNQVLSYEASMKHQVVKVSITYDKLGRCFKEKFRSEFSFFIIIIRYENQNANLRCSVNRKPIRHDFHASLKHNRCSVNIVLDKTLNNWKKSFFDGVSICISKLKGTQNMNDNTEN